VEDRLGYYIGNTDLNWFRFLKELKPEDVNFWKPGGTINFRAITPGSPFLFKLKSPINKIAGVGFFSSFSILPINFAWDVFGTRNGVDNLQDFYKRIGSYRTNLNSIEHNPNIGCIVLTDPVFFDECDWIEQPASWRISTQQGKKYSTTDNEGKLLWDTVISKIALYKSNMIGSAAEQEESYAEYLTKVRIGQGAFRVRVTDAYMRRCAISGEKTLPVLDAAHIKAFSDAGPNEVNNGLLLRSDIHKLFDHRYITVNSDYIIEVSRKIREEFENGREYYSFHGKPLASIPKKAADLPSKQFLEWHNERFKW
jgi:putative restriction endonuclease